MVFFTSLKAKEDKITKLYNQQKVALEDEDYQQAQDLEAQMNEIENNSNI